MTENNGEKERKEERKKERKSNIRIVEIEKKEG